MSTSIKPLSEEEQARCLARNPKQKYTQHWHKGGAPCLTSLLCEVGTWWVGSYNDRHANGACDAMIDEGYVTYRTHYIPGDYDGPGDQCYEITDKGLDLLRGWVGMHTIAHVIHIREFYRERLAIAKKRRAYVKKIDKQRAKEV